MRKHIPVVIMAVGFIMSLIGLYLAYGIIKTEVNKPKEPTKYALIVTASDRGERGDSLRDPLDKNNFWLNEVRVYNALRDAGFKRDNIKVLYVDGKPDYKDTIEVLKIKRIREEKPFMIEPATKETIESSIKEFADKVTEQDMFVMYLGTHGAESLVEIRNGHHEWTTTEVQLALQQIHPKLGIFYSDACHSGAFIDRLSLPDFILVSTTGTETYGWGDRFFSGGSMFFQSFTDPEADTNMDGKITVREAYERGQVRSIEHMNHIDNYLRTRYNYDFGSYDEMMNPNSPGTKASVIQNMNTGYFGQDDSVVYNLN